MVSSPPSSPDGIVDVERLPWMVFPDASFCTIGHDDNNAAAAAFSFHGIIPGLPADDNVTCLGAAADGWLALDLTDDVYRRTPLCDSFCHDTGKFVEARPDVKHAHAYMLHNPFSGETVPLPELDAIVGDDAAETFQIRKVLMRSSSSSPEDDVVAVVTNNWNHNIILCRPGKGMFVLPYFRVFDAQFVGGSRLYGITPDEDLLVFHLAEDDDGRPIVTNCRRVIKHKLADDEEDLFSWMDDNDDDDSGDWDDGDEGVSSDHEDDENDVSFFNGDVLSDGEDIVEDDEVPYEPKDYICTTRHLVKSPSGEELLMVRHHKQVPPISRDYTRQVEVFKADIEAGQWVPMITGDVLPEGEALFLSIPFCKSTRVHGDIIKDGSIYSTDIDDVFDTRSGTCRRVSLPRQWRSADTRLLTWLFPPEQQVVWFWNRQ